jgi:hypothetical protein
VSGVICPESRVNCPDDVCRGSGRCVATDTPLLDRCSICGAVFDPDIEDCACPCDDHYDDDFDDEEDN